MKVYMVSSGEYSDFGYVAAFSTHTLAQQFIASQSHNLESASIYEWEIDDMKEPVELGLQRFHLRLSPAGDVIECGTRSSNSYEWATTIREEKRSWDGQAYRDDLHYVVVCWARDGQHAAKIAMEKLMRHKAYEKASN